MKHDESKNNNKFINVGLIFRIINIVVCVLFVFCLLIYANLGKIATSILNPDTIKQAVNKNTGLLLDLSEPKISSTKDLCIKITAPVIILSEPNNSPSNLLNIKNAEVSLKILPLLFKKVEFKKLTADDLTINIIRAKDGVFNFQKYLKNDAKMPFKLQAKNTIILVDKYTLDFNDEINNTKAQISGENLISSEFNLDSYADIKTKGIIKIANRNKAQNSPFALDIKLKFPLDKNLGFDHSKFTASVQDIDFSLFKPYISEFISKDIRDFSGHGTLFIMPSGNTQNSITFKLNTSDLFIKIYKNKHDNFINIKDKADILLAARFKKKELIVDDFSFQKNKINITAKGTIKNITKNFNSINPDIVLKIKNSSLAEGLKTAPDYLFKMQQDYIPLLKKYNANGIVNGEFRVKDRVRFPNMYGYIKLDDVYLLERPKNAKTSSGEVLFDGSDVTININANCPNNQKVIVKGRTEIKEVPFAKFDIQSTPAIDIEFAHKILIPIHEIFGFQLGPLPFMKVSGNGQISLKTEGTRESAKLNGFFRTKNGRASLDGLNTTLYNGNLNLLFNGKKIVFDNTTGLAEGAKVKIDGNSDVEGNLDLYVKIFDVNAEKALGVVKTSEMILGLLNGGAFLDSYTNPKGNIDFNMRLWGKAEEFSGSMNFEPNDNLKAKGIILFKNNAIDIFPEIKASKVNGNLEFTDFVTLNLNANIYNSPFNITGTIKPDTKASKIRAEQPQIVDLAFKSKSASSYDLYKFFYDNQDAFQSKNKISRELYEFLNKINFKFAADIRAKGKVNPTDTILDMKKFTLDGWAVGLNNKNSDVLFNSGMVKFKDQKLLFNNLNATLWNANVITNGNVDKIFDDIFIPDLKFNLVSFPFSKITDLTSVIDEDKIKKILNDYTDFSGSISGDFFYNKNGFSGNTNLNKVSLYDKKRDVPVNLNSGDLRFSNNQLRLNALNMTYGATPVYLDAVIDDINCALPRFNVYVSTNLNEESLDKLLNPMLQFPLKTKGELTLKGRLRGQFDNYTAFGTVILNPQTDLYFMGANLGDTQSKREINTRIDFRNDEIRIGHIKYQKYILSQNNKETPYEMLNVSGLIKTIGKDIIFNNLRVKTPNPAPARLLNPVFKKSVLKQGTLSADILFNGPILKPNVNGSARLSNVDVPLYETQVRDVDLTLDDKFINAVLEGEGMGSDVKFKAQIINSAALPVVVNKAEITSKKLNLNKFINSLSNISKAQKTTDPANKQTQLLSPADFEIKNGKFTVDEIYYNNIKASNLSGSFKHTKDGKFIFNDILFDIAGGKIKTNGSYEFATTKFTINSEITDCDANTLVTDILGAKNQVFGKPNGKIYFTGTELNTASSINKVKANVDFAIYDGKMPKLGSLEYLLRAGNLVKSGILGFTINNVIEVLIPYKTGEFKKISGDFIIEDGKIDKMSIYSKGDNLSIYTNGSYDIATKIGDFEVFGKLSTKISNLLGPVGNASLNSFLNLFTDDKIDKKTKEGIIKDVEKIPDIAGSSSDFRLFAVKILGDMNADNFVKSFNWLN